MATYALKTEELIRFEDLSETSSIVQLRTYVVQEGMNVKGASKADIYKKIKDVISKSHYSEEVKGKKKVKSEVSSGSDEVEGKPASKAIGKRKVMSGESTEVDEVEAKPASKAEVEKTVKIEEIGFEEANGTVCDEMKRCFIGDIPNHILAPVRVAESPKDGLLYTQMLVRDMHGHDIWETIVEVSKNYTLISNETAIAVTMNSIKAALGSYPSASLFWLKGWRGTNYQMGVQLEHDKFPTADLGDPLHGSSDTIKAVLFLLNSYDKSSSFKIAICAFRNVCSNGCLVYKYICPHLNFHHYKKIDYADSIKEYLGELFERFSSQAALWKQWSQEIVGDEYHEQFRNHLCDEEFIGINEFVDEKRLEGTTCTKWEFFNHVTFYTTHVLQDPNFTEAGTLRTRLVEFFYGKEEDVDSDYKEDTSSGSGSDGDGDNHSDSSEEDYEKEEDMDHGDLDNVNESEKEDLEDYDEESEEDYEDDDDAY